MHAAPLSGIGGLHCQVDREKSDSEVRSKVPTPLPTCRGHRLHNWVRCVSALKAYATLVASAQICGNRITKP